jgi:hypothetical protein
MPRFFILRHFQTFLTGGRRPASGNETCIILCRGGKILDNLIIIAERKKRLAIIKEEIHSDIQIIREHRKKLEKLRKNEEQ